MGTLVDDMKSLADEVIGSFIKRRQDLQKLDRDVNDMIARYEAERQKMGVELQKKLARSLSHWLHIAPPLSKLTYSAA
jgi:hypothetical protein